MTNERSVEKQLLKEKKYEHNIDHGLALIDKISKNVILLNVDIPKDKISPNKKKKKRMKTKTSLISFFSSTRCFFLRDGPF